MVLVICGIKHIGEYWTRGCAPCHRPRRQAAEGKRGRPRKDGRRQPRYRSNNLPVGKAIANDFAQEKAGLKLARLKGQKAPQRKQWLCLGSRGLVSSARH